MSNESENTNSEAHKAGKLAELKGMLGEVGRALTDEVGIAQAAISDKAFCLAGATRRCVAKNPWAMVGIAAAVAVLVGSLLARRGKAD